MAVAILPVNTALFALDDDDHGKLWIGRRALRGPAAELGKEPADLRIAAMHHPTDWFSDVERAPIRRSLREAADVILTGHLHDPDVALVTSQSTEVLLVAAGAAYQGSKYPCKLFFGSYHGATIRLRPYHWADGADRWVLDTSVFPDAVDYEGLFASPGGERA